MFACNVHKNIIYVNNESEKTINTKSHYFNGYVSCGVKDFNQSVSRKFIYLIDCYHK